MQALSLTRRPTATRVRRRLVTRRDWGHPSIVPSINRWPIHAYASIVQSRATDCKDTERAKQTEFFRHSAKRQHQQPEKAN